MNDIRDNSARCSVLLKSASILLGIITAAGLYAPPVSAEALTPTTDEDNHIDASQSSLFDWNEFNTQESSTYFEETYAENYHKQEVQNYSHEKEKSADCHCAKQEKEVTVVAAEVKAPPVSAPPVAAPAQPKPAPTQAAPPEVLGVSTALVASGPVEAGQTKSLQAHQPRTFSTGLLLVAASIALFITTAVSRRSLQQD